MTANPPQSVFVGVSGASGAPYAARLVQALAAAGCRLQLSISESGVLVLEHELELAAAGREAVTAAFLERAGATAEVFAPDDLGALPASGSSAPDAVVICPCSMSTAAQHRARHQRTLMHRAADVALKERRPLVVVPAGDAADRRSTCAGCSSSPRPAPSCCPRCRASTRARRPCRTPSTTSPAR